YRFSLSFVSILSLLRVPPISPLFPYTTLFRSDVDAARILLVDLENLSDAAVLPVRSVGSSVLEFQAVLDDPLARRFQGGHELLRDRKSTRLNPSHQIISYAVFCLKKKMTTKTT